MDNNIVNRIANPVNEVASAYQGRTNQLTQQREAESAKEAAAQQQRDNEMLKVFEFAGDGYVDEARYYAQQKGIEVPDAVYKNADFAKGLTLAGKIYGNDPAAAQKFTQAWMGTQGDFDTRLTQAQQAAGVPINPEDRELQRKIEFERWKLNNVPRGSDSFTLGPNDVRYGSDGTEIARGPSQPPISRYEAGQKAYNEAMGSLTGSPDIAEQAMQRAYAEWDAAYGNQGGGQQPMQNQQMPTPQPVEPTQAPSAQLQRSVYAVQELMLKGYTVEQIESNLIQRGASPQQARAIVQQASGG